MSKNLSSSALLELVHMAGSQAPSTVHSALGEFSWNDRVSKVDVDSEKPRIHFFSDGLDLKTKMAVEENIRATVAKQAPETATEVVVYFERKNKAPTQENSQSAEARAQAKQQAAARSGASSHSHSHGAAGQTSAPPGRRGIKNVKHIIAVASGKGGVGKSTVSVNLAMALYNQGYKVGILDADIYGPSLPIMLGINADPTVNDENKIVPPERFGLKVMSFGFFAPPESAVIWRGPMIMKALQQFFYDVDWGELDFLVIDLPPGTGDAQLTLVQSLPISGSVIVTTPQNVALADAVKGIVMFQKTDVPILGVVENMSTYHCPSCGTESHIFGTGGAQHVSQRFEVPVLGNVPLMGEIRAAGDNGTPLTSQNGHPMRVRFAEIAEKAVKRIFEVQKTAN